MIWEKLTVLHKPKLIRFEVYRAKVRGGWLVYVRLYKQGGLTFYPDPGHSWDGKSLP